MAKRSSKKKTGSRRTTGSKSASGKHLVIVESPAKAKTINKYLGPEYVVEASVGHIRDLPARAPKGEKQPVPGVDLEHGFEPTYEVVSGKKKQVAALKKLAKDAQDVWFATDLDREGEAIAWHLTQELGIDPRTAKRVVFNAITRQEITRAFEDPQSIDLDRVDAQQARRILDRIVGYLLSPFLWRKVARGLAAGRVQSVAVRLIVDREREIRAFIPDEYWRVTARLTAEHGQTAALRTAWSEFIAQRDERNRGPAMKVQNAWLADRGAVRAELVKLGGRKFELERKDEEGPLDDRVRKVCDAVGFSTVALEHTDNPEGRGPARVRTTVRGELDPATRYRVASVSTKRSKARPNAPFITSSLQMAASSALSFGTSRTMRTAQSLYEGVNVPGEGQVGLITYMRTDSTHLSPEALGQAREYIRDRFGSDYLPEKPNYFGSSNKSAQEAHEAIRPTDVRRTPDAVASALTPEQAKLYRLIWNRFVACQMTPAEWDKTIIEFERSDRDTGAVLRANGRVLAFDGFYRVAGMPAGDEPVLPSLAERDEASPFGIDADQLFTAPPARYSEASLVKKLESEGIGRPSTYAAIVQKIQDQKYVELVERSFHATDLGEVVTDKLVEAVPNVLDLGFTREMELELDEVAGRQRNWREMLTTFFGPFAEAVDHAMENSTHAKAEVQPAPYRCPECGARTCYRFGKNGRFLSCGAYPDCSFASPIDREGRPLLAERVNVACPEDGSAMELRSGRFGKFLASVNYPDVKFVLNLDKKGGIKLPAVPPYLTDEECPKCGEKLNLRRGKRGPWLGCSKFPKCRGRGQWAKLDEDVRAKLERALEAHEKEHPQVVVTTLDGAPVPEGTPIADLTLPGGVRELEIHPEAAAERAAEQARDAARVNGTPALQR